MRVIQFDYYGIILVVRKTFKYKAKISKTTEAHTLEWLWLNQQLYNLALEQRIKLYQQRKESLSTFSQNKQLPELKAAFPEFRKVNSQVLQATVERLGKAFDGFFYRLKQQGVKAGFPRFKPVHRFDSFTLKQTGWKLDGRHLKIKNLGIFKLHLSRPIEGRIKTITVKRDARGHWFVSFSCDQVPVKDYHEPSKNAVGVDVGLHHFTTDSDGYQIANPRHYRKVQNKLRRQQRKVSRRKKGSNSRRKAVKALAKTHQKIKNMRTDFLHKSANHYIENYQTICVEKLQVKNMVKNKYLSKSIHDAGWSTFIEFLLYKAEEAGREVIQVNPKGTSQICSGCGSTVKKSLAVRMHRCPDCKLELDRDINAARNIVALGTGSPPELQREPAGCA